MFVVFAACGKQYKAGLGDVIYLDAKLGEEGKNEVIKDILLVGGNEVLIGEPLVKGASLTGEVLRHKRGEKIMILKHKRRKNHRKNQGHRQDFTRLLVTEINTGKETQKLDSKKREEILSTFARPSKSESVSEEKAASKKAAAPKKKAAPKKTAAKKTAKKKA